MIMEETLYTSCRLRSHMKSGSRCCFDFSISFTLFVSFRLIGDPRRSNRTPPAVNLEAWRRLSTTVASGLSRSGKIELTANLSCWRDTVSLGLTKSRSRRMKRLAMNLKRLTSLSRYASDMRLVEIARAWTRTTNTPLRTSKTRICVLRNHISTSEMRFIFSFWTRSTAARSDLLCSASGSLPLLRSCRITLRGVLVGSWFVSSSTHGMR